MISAIPSRPLFSTSTAGTTGTTGTTSTGNTGSTASGTTATDATPGGAMGKDQFMKLLIAQMQNQDPMNPMDGSQMASQLAQFSSLEQLQEINTTLSGQSTASSSLLGAVQTNAAITTIGHSVLAVGNQVQVGGGEATQSVTVDVGANAKSATLNIYDANGKVVGHRDLGALTGGRQTLDIGDAASGLAAGTYTYGVDATDADGNAVTVNTYMTGRVDGISSGSNGLVLNIGNLQLPYSSVISVTN
jgi:flagellar basal-body rod modification protein FlgD